MGYSRNERFYLAIVLVLLCVRFLFFKIKITKIEILGCFTEKVTMDMQFRRRYKYGVWFRQADLNERQSNRREEMVISMVMSENMLFFSNSVNENYSPLVSNLD